MSELKRYRIKQANWAYMQQSDDGDYVRYEDYAALEAELTKLRAELAAFKSAVDHVTADGKTTRSFSASEGWSMVHCDRLTDLHVAEERLSELGRRL